MPPSTRPTTPTVAAAAWAPLEDFRFLLRKLAEVVASGVWRPTVKDTESGLKREECGLRDSSKVRAEIACGAWDEEQGGSRGS